ncbi:dockerin type I repeat-containing protein [Ruminococcus flavefaciens]|uniref:dockerin type I repeat-containing protein n=1 Tax=Ruminococcus flavefaciens TaxID=1265 RepID=UPI00048B2AAF|nr:dockerin type I repeat-containing protein [Ruminococcus flavefaciens]
MDGAVCVVFEIEYDAPDPDVNYFENRFLFNATNGVRGSAKLNYYFNENDLEDNTVYVVAAITSIPAAEFEVEFIDKAINSSIDTAHPHSVGHYSFKGIAKYTTIETDIYGWLPDCEPEYKDYVEKYGVVSVRDNFVVFCMDSNAGTPFTWQEKSNNYSDNFKLKASLFCNNETAEPVEGGKLHRVAVYQAVKDGYAKIEWGYIPNQTWELEPPFSEDDLKDTLTADCVILDDAQAVLLNGQTRVAVTDEDTGELMSDKYLESYPFKFHADIIYKAELFSSLSGDVANYTVTKNKNILQEGYLCPNLSSLAAAYKKADLFKITTEEPPEIIYYDNDAMDMIFKTSKPPLGDLNNDKIFSISDLVLLQRWLLGASDIKITDWSLADFNEDNKVDVFDLCHMRKALINSIDIPISISITETGGYAGVHRIWKVYQENDKFFVYYKNENSDTEPSVIEISEHDYREIMSQDYDTIIKKYNSSQHEVVMDGFIYNTVLNYENGSEKQTSADMSNIIYNISKSLNIKFS